MNLALSLINIIFIVLIRFVIEVKELNPYFMLYTNLLTGVLLMLGFLFKKVRINNEEQFKHYLKYEPKDSFINLIALMIFGLAPALTANTDYLASFIVYLIMFVGLIYYFCKERLKVSWIEFKDNTKSKMPLIIVFIVVITVLMILLMVMVLYRSSSPDLDIVDKLNIELAVDEYFTFHQPLGNVLIILFDVMFIPIVEELLFRDKIYCWFKGKMTRGFAMILISIIFAIFHFPNVFIITIAGLIFVFAYDYYDDNVYASIFMHSLWNIVIAGLNVALALVVL